MGVNGTVGARLRSGLRGGFAALVAALLLTATAPQPGHADEVSSAGAFIEFLAARNYENANFYLQNGLVRPEELDTGAIFYNILRDRYWESLNRDRNHVLNLYNYLAALKPFDLNQPVDCGRDGEAATCRLLPNLARSGSAQALLFFADLGLDLNRVFPGEIPATFYVVDDLGVRYSLGDIQMLSQKGMVFGDEMYDSAALAQYRDTWRHRRDWDGESPGMPHNYLSIPQFNFMDALVIALGRPLRGSEVTRAVRDDLLCKYVVFVAAQMQPSFDYLRYLLIHRDSFRADQIGVRRRTGSQPYEPFPAACVSLIAGMAQNHGRLDDIIAMFGARGDVDMARWLLALQQPPQTQPVPPAQPAQAAPNPPPTADGN